MNESRQSLAVNAALFILLILAIVIVVPLFLATPVEAASPEPTGSLVAPITGTPGPTGYEPPAVWSTPPPTDATTVTVTLTDGGWLSVLVLTGAAVVGLLVTLRRLSRCSS